MEENKQTIYLAGGCFWGVEELFHKQPGVLSTEVGYTGGQTQDPTYEQVKTGTTGHAEALKIEFDSGQTSMGRLLDFFFSIHDPTTVNRQGNDRGSQYRSAIFYNGDKQKQVAEEVIAKVSTQGHWTKPVVTQLEAFDKFYSAEEYHRDYLQKNPGGYTCHWQRYEAD